MKYNLIGFTNQQKGIMIGERINRTPDDFIEIVKLMFCLAPGWDKFDIVSDEDPDENAIVIYEHNLVEYENKVYYENEFIAFLERIGF